MVASGVAWFQLLTAARTDDEDGEDGVGESEGRWSLPRQPGLHPVVVLLSLLCWTLLLPLATGFFTGQSEDPVKRIQAVCGAQLLLLILITQIAGFRPWDNRPDPAGWLWALKCGGHGFLLAAMPVYSLMIALSSFRTEDSEHSFLRLLSERQDAMTLVTIALAAVVLAPLMEELVFRVILQGGLQQVTRPVTAVIAVAVVFCAIHVSSLERIPDAIALFPLALIMGITYQKTGSYVAVVVTHGCFNATNLLLALIAA